MKIFDVVAAADRFAVDQDIGNGFTASGSPQCLLETRAEFVLVEFDHIWRWTNLVAVEENVL